MSTFLLNIYDGTTRNYLLKTNLVRLFVAKHFSAKT